MHGLWNLIGFRYNSIYAARLSDAGFEEMLLLAKIYNFWQVCSFVGLSVCLSVLSSITHERFDISSPNLVHIWNGWAVPVCDIDKWVGHGTRSPGQKIAKFFNRHNSVNFWATSSINSSKCRECHWLTGWYNILPVTVLTKKFATTSKFRHFAKILSIQYSFN